MRTASGGDESSVETTEAPPAPPAPRGSIADPVDVQIVARAFAYLKNARLVALGQAEEPLDGHVKWATGAGRSNTCGRLEREGDRLSRVEPNSCTTHCIR